MKLFKDRYVLSSIDYHTAMDLIVSNHYLHRRCPCSHALSLIDMETGNIKGIVTYGVPPSSTLLKGICGEEEAKNVYELNRLWVSDDMPKNSESFLIANSMKRLDREIVVSYADTGQGHIGYVYQATNFLYTGMSKKFKDLVVKGIDKHHATIGDRKTYDEIKEQYGEENVYYQERSRKHRYIFFNCDKRKRKELLSKLKYAVLPYPKL